MAASTEYIYQEGGVRHPDAVAIDIVKHPKVQLKEITKLTGWWGDEGVLGLEIEHRQVSVKGLCEPAHKTEPAHCASLKMADGEYLTEVLGQTTSKIERLTFKTSRGTAITFGNDKPDGTDFRLFQKNYRVAAITVGIGKHMHFIGVYLTFSPSTSPALVPKQGEFGGIKVSLEEEEQKNIPQYPKAIGYEIPKALPIAEHKALENPETYGKFNDFEWAIKEPIHGGKKVEIKEVMLYYSTVKKLVLGYRLKYEIRDPTKASGKIVELKHVAPNPLTPTLHVVRIINEGEFITKVKGRRNKATEGITYLAFEMSTGGIIEAGVNVKEAEESSEEFELRGEGDQTIIAFAGKVTNALNAIGIYCIKQ